MSTEAVKRQILLAVDALSISPNRVPSVASITDACAAAKLLRNRILRERIRVIERIEVLRERQLYDETSCDDADYADDDAENQIVGSDLNRSEFVFICEMMVAEKLVVPLLLAHGMNFSDTLLPQLLKLLAVMLLPIPRFSANEVLQKDMLQKIKIRCGTDDFFGLLVHCVAPIAEKRMAGELQRDDAVLLEIVLTLITHLLDGYTADMERIIGAFCRNQGVELFLVVVNQSYSRIQAVDGVLNGEVGNYASIKSQAGKNENDKNANESSDLESKTMQVTSGIDHEEEVDEIDLEDDDSTSLSLSQNIMGRTLDEEFQVHVNNLLESSEQLWKWNCLALASMSSIICCLPPEEFVQLTLLGHTSDSSPDRVLSTLLKKREFRDCKKASDKWRLVARSRSGAVTSNGILVRASQGGAPKDQAIGTVFSLLGPRRKDPLEAMKEIDFRKRGRFVKGMLQGTTPQCNLPLTTKIQLSHQNSSFLSFGFEPLSAMVFSKLQDIATVIERATKEHNEAVVGCKGSGEALEVTSPLDTSMYQNLGHVLHYMTLCGCILRYARLISEQLKSEQKSFILMFPQQWQSVSSIISLDYLELGFSVLRSFLDCKDIRRREDITVVVGYLAEILLILYALLQGEIAADSAVEVAAHALASSVLYKEENIKAVFGLLSENSNRIIPIRKAQVFTLFTSSVFQLMEKCSYRGNLLLPKRLQRPKGDKPVFIEEAEDMGGVHNQDDIESVNSAMLAELRDEMLQDVESMIDDEESDGGVRPPASIDSAQIKGNPGNPETVPRPVDSSNQIFESLETAALVNSGNSSPSERAASEGPPASITSSSRTVLSTISSEREVAVSGFFHRLASPKNIGLLYSTLRHWRVNDADVNIALTFLMEALVRNCCESVFFNVAFLLLMREVLINGEKTHAPLYAVCDRIVYNFFNPSFAKAQDARAATELPKEVDNGILGGAQSYLGFEVSLRCARALFNFSTLDYTYVEEKGMPHLMSYTAKPLPDEDVLEVRRNESAAVGGTTLTPATSHSKTRRETPIDDDDDDGGRIRYRVSSEDDKGDEHIVLSPEPVADALPESGKRRSQRRHRTRRSDEKRKRYEVIGVAAAGEEKLDSAGSNHPSRENNINENVSAATSAEVVSLAVSFLDSAEETLVVEEAE